MACFHNLFVLKFLEWTLKGGKMDNLVSHYKVKTGSKSQKSFLRWFLIVLLLAGILRGYFFEPYRVNNYGMEKTLQKKQKILIEKLSYGIRFLPFNFKLFKFNSPTRGDLICFYDPRYNDFNGFKEIFDLVTFSFFSTSNSQLDLKRVLGLPGDRIRIDGFGMIYINGKKITEERHELGKYILCKEFGWEIYFNLSAPTNNKNRIFPKPIKNKTEAEDFIRRMFFRRYNIEEKVLLSTVDFKKSPDYDIFQLNKKSEIRLKRENTGFLNLTENNDGLISLVIPPHHYFVIGDNRDISIDSRDWGLIDYSSIVGTPLFRFSPLKKLGFID